MRSLLVLSAAVLLISACAPSKDMPTAPSSSTAAQALSAAPSAFGLVTRSQVQSVSGASLGACLSSAGLAGCSFEPGVSFEGGGAPPNAPNNLTASATGSVVTLAWSPPVPEDGILTYVVEAGSSPGLANLASVNTGSGNPSLVTGGVPPGTYYVRVRAATIGGAGPASNEVTLVVGGGTPGCAGPPSAPANFAIATNAGGRVVLTWSASSGPGVSYVVQVGSSPGASNLLQSGTAATSVTATSVAAGTYYARVVAQSSCGTSGPSNEVTIVVGSAAVPNANVAGVWDVTASPGPFRPYSRFTVTITQSGATLGGTILPVGTARTTRVLGSVAGNAIRFGSETAWWNDVINGRPDIGSDFYFNMTLDATGRAMTGTCSQPCGVATATRR